MLPLSQMENLNAQITFDHTALPNVLAKTKKVSDKLFKEKPRRASVFNRI